MKYYPINLDVGGRKVLVVGGGAVALRKAKRLLACGARLTAVSPRFRGRFASLKGTRLVRRGYRKSDLRGACLVIGAAGSEEVNARVARDAREMNLPVNVVDRPELCNFTLPAVAQRGDLVIAVSTGGASPALARNLRRKFEAEIDPTYARYVALLKEMRERVMASPLDAKFRARLFRRMADDKVHRTLVEKGVPTTRRLLRAMLANAVNNCG